MACSSAELSGSLLVSLQRPVDCCFGLNVHNVSVMQDGSGEPTHPPPPPGEVHAHHASCIMHLGACHVACGMWHVTHQVI